MTAHTRDSRIADQHQFINALALLVPIEDHINHPENTCLYIAFSFNEKQGPVRVAEREFTDARFLKLLVEFNDVKKGALSYLVFVVAERRQPQLYSRDQEPEPTLPKPKLAKGRKPSTSKSRSRSRSKKNKSPPLSEEEDTDDVKAINPRVCLYNTFSIFKLTNLFVQAKSVNAPIIKQEPKSKPKSKPSKQDIKPIKVRTCLYNLCLLI
jgi:hypothetical protein